MPVSALGDKKKHRQVVHGDGNMQQTGWRLRTVLRTMNSRAPVQGETESDWKAGERQSPVDGRTRHEAGLGPMTTLRSRPS